MHSQPDHIAWRDDLVRTAPDGAPAQAVLAALDSFLRDESKLLIIDVHERTITESLARHLRPQLPDWDVDCELECTPEVGQILRSG